MPENDQFLNPNEEMMTNVTMAKAPSWLSFRASGLFRHYGFRFCLSAQRQGLVIRRSFSRLRKVPLRATFPAWH
jgi:hypothetical protein